jgi:hypothetical protein
MSDKLPRSYVTQLSPTSRIMIDIEYLLSHGRPSEPHEARDIRAAVDRCRIVSSNEQGVLFGMLRHCVHECATEAQAQSLSAVPITDTLGRLFFRIEHAVIPRLHEMLDIDQLQRASKYPLSLDAQMRGVCPQLIAAHRDDVEREAADVVATKDPSSTKSFVRLLRTGVDLGEHEAVIAATEWCNSPERRRDCHRARQLRKAAISTIALVDAQVLAMFQCSSLLEKHQEATVAMAVPRPPPVKRHRYHVK